MLLLAHGCGPPDREGLGTFRLKSAYARFVFRTSGSVQCAQSDAFKSLAEQPEHYPE